jgi:hypothetical protein
METTVEVDGKEVKIYVSKPTNQVNREAEIFRTKTWADCAKNGIPTKKQLEQILRDNGSWDNDKLKKELELGLEIARLEKTLYRGDGKGRKPKLSEGRDIAIQIRQKRYELRELISEKIKLEEMSAENLADNAKFDFLVAHCTFYEDGTRVYKTFDEYNNTDANTLAFAAASMLAKMMYNIDNDFEKQLPENKFLVKYKLVNDDLSLIDPEKGYTVDLQGNRIDNEGYFVNEEGERVDRDGNLLTEDGMYDLVEYDNDLVTAKPAPAKKTTTRKKKTTNQTTES